MPNLPVAMTPPGPTIAPLAGAIKPGSLGGGLAHHLDPDPDLAGGATSSWNVPKIGGDTNPVPDSVSTKVADVQVKRYR